MFNGYFEVALADQDLTRPASWLEQVRTTLGKIMLAWVVILVSGVATSLLLGYARNKSPLAA
jgi:hypothetical protein